MVDRKELSYKEQVIANSKIDTAPGTEKVFDKFVHEQKGDYCISFDDNNAHTLVTFNPVTKRVKVASYKMTIDAVIE
jgi:aminopeptidase-like protein